nr:hypothetical protein Iba_chr01fCG2870 [Ipomoea batatas]
MGWPLSLTSLPAIPRTKWGSFGSPILENGGLDAL